MASSSAIPHGQPPGGGHESPYDIQTQAHRPSLVRRTQCSRLPALFGKVGARTRDTPRLLQYLRASSAARGKTLKREAINHTKMRRLARYLDIEIYSARGIMETLWSATCDEAPAGNIGKLSDEDLADIIGWKGDAEALTAAMVRAGWLDTTDTYRLVIHDWPDHCQDYVHAKLAKAGMRFANGSIPQISKLNQAQRKNVPTEFKMPPAFEPDSIVAAPAPNVAATEGANAAPAREPSAPALVPYPSHPIHTLPDPTTPTALGVALPRLTEYPKTDAAVRRCFATADLRIVLQIVQAATQEFVSSDTPKIPEMGDTEIAAAVEQAWKESSNQTSAALFKTTVPAVVKTWCLHGRRMATRAGPQQKSVVGDVTRVIQARLDKGENPW